MKPLISLVAVPALLIGCSTEEAALDTNSDEIVVDDSVESVGEMPAVTEFKVVVGENSGPDQTLTVAQGSTVRLFFVNPNDDDEIHLHGYDLGGSQLPAGEEAIFEFVADETGTFDVESHVTGEVLMVLVVE
jgi:FtsP/CotA-like multicopper oxidase with cupredoxin domain